MKKADHTRPFVLFCRLLPPWLGELRPGHIDKHKHPRSADTAERRVKAVQRKSSSDARVIWAFLPVIEN